MDKTEAINVAFLAGVIIVLVAAFVYVNVFYEEPEEEEEGDGEETETFIDLDVPAYDAIEETAAFSAVPAVAALDTPACC